MLIHIARHEIRNQMYLCKNQYETIFVSIRNGQGSAVFIKNGFEYYHDTFSDDKISAIFVSLENVDLIFLYISKQFSWNKLKTVLEKWIKNERRVAILGDMNWQYDSEANEMKTYLEKSSGFKPYHKP